MNFRRDNEWAGTLLDKLYDTGIVLDSSKDIGGFYWFVSARGYRGHASTWRDAVVEAVLEIARRELK